MVVQGELRRAAPLAALPRLALDAVGGAASARLAEALADGGSMVVYGCLSGHPPELPWQAWVHRGLQARLPSTFSKKGAGRGKSCIYGLVACLFMGAWDAWAGTHLSRPGRPGCTAACRSAWRFGPQSLEALSAVSA